jgi:hypothetical protein
MLNIQTIYFFLLDMLILCVVTLYEFAGRYESFGETYCFHLQDQPTKYLIEAFFS